MDMRITGLTETGLMLLRVNWIIVFGLCGIDHIMRLRKWNKHSLPFLLEKKNQRKVADGEKIQSRNTG